MYLTGFADEAAEDIAGQIEATRALGWDCLEARNVDGRNLHDLDEAAFEAVAEALEHSGIRVNALGSTIANWACPIEAPWEDSMAAARRAVPRMRRLGVRAIRIMSFAVCADRPAEDQFEPERIRRLRAICGFLTGEGMQPLHENCMNYGGLSWRHTLRLVEAVPGLRLVFDTANPGLALPHSPRQSSWEFYRNVREHIAHVHVKDMRWDDGANAPVYTFPGEGDREVRRILTDLLREGYDGGIAIEPHMQVVFHDRDITAKPRARMENYVAYGRKLEALIADIRTEISA